MEEIKTKKCFKCGEEKPMNADYFTRSKRSKDGFFYNCKDCNSERGRVYRENNREKELQRSRTYTKNNLEKILEKSRLYTQNNPEKVRQAKLKYAKNNREKVRKSKIDYMERKSNDPMFRLIRGVRATIRGGILASGFSKNTQTYKLLGCSYEDLKKHIESQFTDGMTWDNQGRYGWHFDHYYPISLAKTPEDMYIFNHYTNLQPLWCRDNWSKNNNIPPGFDEWYKMMKEKIYGNSDD